MKDSYPIVGYIRTTHYGTIPVLNILMRDDAKDKKASCLTADQSTRQET